MWKKFTTFIKKNTPGILPGIYAVAVLVLFVWVPSFSEWEMQLFEDAGSFIMEMDNSPGAGMKLLATDNYPVSVFAAAVVASFLPGSMAGIFRICGLVALLTVVYSVMSLGKNMFSRSVGITAGWLSASTCIFIYWSRQYFCPDMLLAAAFSLALAWAYARRRGAGFASYCFFYGCVFAAVAAKGMPVLPLILISVIVLLAFRKMLSRHWNLRHLAAVVCCAFVFALFCAGLSAGYIAVADREFSFTVFKEIFLHILGTFYSGHSVFVFNIYDYFCEIIIFSLPWIIFIVPAVLGVFRKLKYASGVLRSLFLATVILFFAGLVCFCLGWNYSICIIPLLMLTAARWMHAERKNKTFFNIADFITLIIASCAVLSPLLLAVIANRHNIELSALMLISLPVAGIIIMIIAVLFENTERHKKIIETALLPGKGTVTLIGCAILSGCIFSCVLPSLELYRTTNAFIRNVLVPESSDIPDNNIVLLSSRIRGDVVFNFDRRQPPVHFSVWDGKGKVDEKLFSAFADYVNWRRDGEILLISDVESIEDVARFDDMIPAWEIEIPQWIEPDNPYSADPGRKIMAWRIE